MMEMSKQAASEMGSQVDADDAALFTPWLVEGWVSAHGFDSSRDLLQHMGADPRFVETIRDVADYAHTLVAMLGSLGFKQVALSDFASRVCIPFGNHHALNTARQDDCLDSEYDLVNWLGQRLTDWACGRDLPEDLRRIHRVGVLFDTALELDGAGRIAQMLRSVAVPVDPSELIGPLDTSELTRFWVAPSQDMAGSAHGGSQVYAEIETLVAGDLLDARDAVTVYLERAAATDGVVARWSFRDMRAAVVAESGRVGSDAMRDARRKAEVIAGSPGLPELPAALLHLNHSQHGTGLLPPCQR